MISKIGFKLIKSSQNSLLVTATDLIHKSTCPFAIIKRRKVVESANDEKKRLDDN